MTWSDERKLPTNVDGYGTITPYQPEDPGRRQPHDRRSELSGNLRPSENGSHLSEPPTRKFPMRGDLREAIGASGLKDGMRISFHHHLRMGDRVVARVLDMLTLMGLSGLTLCLSSVMGPACESVVRAVRAGVIGGIETTGVKGPLAEALAEGSLPFPVIFRSHGGRAAAIDSGRTPIDVAFIAASAIGPEGDLTGAEGPNRFGSLGYAIPDALNSGFVIAITDHMLDRAPRHISISGRYVDAVVVVESIGDRTEIAGGSLRVSRNPLEQVIARHTLRAIVSTGMVREGVAFQAGSGGVSLSVATEMASFMRSQGVRGSFISGGVTGALVGLLKEGLVDVLYDVQSFDDAAVTSLGTDRRHIEMSASEYASPLFEQCIAHRLDVMVLSATEIDTDFQVNSVTGTDGRVIGALGGAPDTAQGAALTVVAMPSFRGRIPTVNRRVNTVCTPGRTVDLLVTERGICVNPRRGDLVDGMRKAGLVLLPIEDLADTVEAITGKPRLPSYGPGTSRDRVTGIVEYRDGSVIDCLWGPGR